MISNDGVTALSDSAPGAATPRRRRLIPATIAVLGLIASILVVSGISDAVGQVRTVSKDGTGNYTTIQAAADAAQPGDTILISGGTYGEAVVVNKSGSSGAPITFQGKPGQKVIVDGTGKTVSKNGLFAIDGRSFLNIDNITVTKSAKHGIYGANVNSINITNCEVSYSQDGGAVFVGGANMVIDTCDVHHNNFKGLSANNEAVSMNNVNGFEVKNSLVHDNKEEGIDAKYEARNGSIHNNRAYSNNGPNIYIDSANNIDVYSNVVYQATGANKSGISIAVENYSTTRKTYDIDVFNNQIFNNAQGGVGFWMESSGTYSNIKIVNNTMYGNVKGDVQFGSTGYTFTGTNVIRNNILWSTINGLSSATKFTKDHNLVADGGANAGFVNLGANDVHLTAASQAIDAGVSTDAPTTDLDGNPRPAGAAIDLGAYEYGSTPPSTTTTTTTPATTTTVVDPTTSTTVAPTTTTTVAPTTTTTVPPSTTTTTVPPSGPLPPTNVSCVANSRTKATVSWRAPSSPNTYRYNVWRSNSTGTNWRQVAQVSKNQLSYADSSLSRNTTYQFQIRTVDTSGRISAASTTCRVTTQR